MKLCDTHEKLLTVGNGPWCPACDRERLIKEIYAIDAKFQKARCLLAQKISPSVEQRISMFLEETKEDGEE